MATFVLSDEKKINSYGFRVNTEGISLERFSANPVMLNEHWNSTASVLGRWLNARKENGQLLAEDEFDVADPDAEKIKGKVDRGYIKGASIGVLFDENAMVRQPNGEWELTKCELLEASICAIPSNAAALRLFVNNDGQLKELSKEEVMLKLSAPNPQTQFLKSENTMKKIILTQAALLALSLIDHNTNEGVDADLVNKKIGELKADYDKTKSELSAANTALATANAALKTLQDAEKEQKKLAAEKLVDDAVAAGKIDATAKESWVSLALQNEEMAKQTLSAIPAKTSLSGKVNNPAPGTADEMTEDKFFALSEADQVAWKEANPDNYKKIFS